MPIKVTHVGEVNAIDSRGNISKSVQLTYFVDSHGPFTVTGTQEELNNGTLNNKMQALAAAINALPLGGQV